MNKFILTPLLLSISVFVTSTFIVLNSAKSASNSTLVRDAETEASIMEYSTPLFEAAGLNPDSINIYLIHDPTLNAFVAGGQNIFIHTGLLMAAEDVAQVIGVIAHETAHIAGGHLARTKNALTSARNASVIASILGVGIGILTGHGDIATAAISGGTDIANRSFLTFSRRQESTADNAALAYLEKTKQSAQGMRDFLRILEDKELYAYSHQDPYLRSHPLSHERIKNIEQHLKSSLYSNVPSRPRWQLAHERIQAKIYAYSNPLKYVLRKYPETDTSIGARYARAFAYYRKPDLNKALKIIDQLLQEFPNDPYFHELRAQMLFEHGQISDALASYSHAVQFSPPSAILYLELGQAQIASEDDTLLGNAELNLRRSIALERGSAMAWRQLAIAYGRQGKMALTSLCLAEEAILRSRLHDAVYYAEKASDLLPEGSREWIQAQDILNAAQRFD